MKKLHFVITGGHHNSALVLARELARLGHQVSWVGHRFAAKNDTQDSAEYLEVTSAGFPFHHLTAGKIGGDLALANFANIPRGFLGANQLLSQLKPDAIISFGSYLGLAVALIAKLRGLPIFLHEQTVVAGKGNLLVARLARRIYLTWDSSQRFFPAAKSLVVGLPLRDSILNPTHTKLFSNSLPTILVLGGKQGSHIINQHLFSLLPNLLTSYNLIHQTGTSSATGDLARAIALQDGLPPKLASHYRPEGYIGESQIGSLLENCDLYLGRSGAHITYELGLLGVRSILIPYLDTHNREQLKNAHFLEKQGATILPQSTLSPTTLTRAIAKCLKQPRPRALALPTQAATTMAKDILHEISL